MLGQFCETFSPSTRLHYSGRVQPGGARRNGSSNTGGAIRPTRFYTEPFTISDKSSNGVGRSGTNIPTGISARLCSKPSMRTLTAAFCSTAAL